MAKKYEKKKDEVQIAITLISQIRCVKDIINFLNISDWSFDKTDVAWNSPFGIEKTGLKLNTHTDFVKVRMQLMYLYSSNYRDFMRILEQKKTSARQLSIRCFNSEARIPHLKNGIHVVTDDVLNTIKKELEQWKS